MKEQVLEILKSELAGAQDNLCRARIQFGKMTDEQLAREYGESERTCGEIFDGYKKCVEELKNCIAWVQDVA